MTEPLPDIVEFRGVTKRFGDFTVIRDVTSRWRTGPIAASSSPSSGRPAAGSRRCCA